MCALSFPDLSEYKEGHQVSGNKLRSRLGFYQPSTITLVSTTLGEGHLMGYPILSCNTSKAHTLGDRCRQAMRGSSVWFCLVASTIPCGQDIELRTSRLTVWSTRGIEEQRNPKREMEVNQGINQGLTFLEPNKAKATTSQSRSRSITAKYKLYQLQMSVINNWYTHVEVQG